MPKAYDLAHAGTKAALQSECQRHVECVVPADDTISHTEPQEIGHHAFQDLEEGASEGKRDDVRCVVSFPSGTHHTTPHS